MPSYGSSSSHQYTGGTGEGQGNGRASSKQLLAYLDMVNIADELEDTRLAGIGERVVREFDIDLSSRSEWEERCDKAMKLALQVSEKKNYPWPSASNVKYPLMTVAAIQFGARAYPAIAAPQPVKGKVIGKDDGVLANGQAPGQFIPMNGNDLPGPSQGAPGQLPQAQNGQAPPEQQWEIEPGAKRDRAERVARHMSYQLTEEMEDWDEDTDKLVHMVPIIGCAFKKTWFDQVMGRNRSELVTAKDCVVNYHARSLETAPRVSHRFELYPYEIQERMRSGLWLAKELGHPADASADDEDAPHEFVEQHRLLDLDDDGYPEPYIVTVHRELRYVMRIRARFDADGIYVNQAGKVAKIMPVHYFTKFPFIPSPDGGFYDIGFGTLLNPMNEAVNSTLNQMIDAGHLQVTGGGFIGRGLRIKGGNHRFRPGEWKPVDVQGGFVRDNVVPLPSPGPSIVLFNLLGLLIDAAKDITSTKDILTGDQQKVEPASTTLARIEQGLKVFNAIYKRLYRSCKAEYKKLYRLNRLYLEPETYFTVMDEAEAIGPEDYDAKSIDVVPVADPSSVTDMQRLAKAEYLSQFADDPFFKGRKIRERMLDAANIEDREDVLIEGEPAMPPEIAEAADKMEIEKRKLQLEEIKLDAELMEAETKAILNLAKAEAEEVGPQLEIYKQEAAVIIERIRGQRQQNGGTPKPRGNGGVAGSPGNP